MIGDGLDHMLTLQIGNPGKMWVMSCLGQGLGSVNAVVYLFMYLFIYLYIYLSNGLHCALTAITIVALW